MARKRNGAARKRRTLTALQRIRQAAIQGVGLTLNAEEVARLYYDEPEIAGAIGRAILLDDLGDRAQGNLLDDAEPGKAPEVAQ